MAEISEATSSNTNASIGISEHGGVPPLPPLHSISENGGVPPRQPLHSDNDTESSALRKVNADEEKLSGRKRYQVDLDQYKSKRAEYNVISKGILTIFIRNIAQKLIRSAFQHLSQAAEGLMDNSMLWRIDVVLGGQITTVKGYPGGGLMVFVGDRAVLVDLMEDELAVLLASAIVDIIDSQSDAEKHLQARAVNGCKFIPQRARSYLTKLDLFTEERERVFSKDQMIVRIIEGADYDRQSIFDWYRKIQLPFFYKFFQPSYKRRARKLRAWLAKDKMPMISQGARQAALRPSWYPDGERIDDLTPEAVELYKGVIKGNNY